MEQVIMTLRRYFLLAFIYNVNVINEPGKVSNNKSLCPIYVSTQYVSG